ncbi:MAG: hypothetical protein J7M12_04730 [Candidatus Hydrogenedentes bacterium]|nr:hypothetical protein [Candidatus Hydrogenedentota bacterium]
MEKNDVPDNGTNRLPSLRDVLSIVFKHKYGVLFLFTAIVAIMTAATYIVSPVYEASSKVMVSFDREGSPLAGTSRPSGSVLTMRSSEEDMRTEMEIIRNNHLIESVVDDLWDELTRVEVYEPTTFWGKAKKRLQDVAGRVIGRVRETGYRLDLFRRLSPRQAQIKTVLKNLKVEAVGDSNVIRITYSSSRPDLSAKIVNAITNAYLEQHIKVHKVPRAHGFFQDQKTMYETALLEQEKKIKAFKEQWSISSIEVQRNLLLEDISKLALADEELQKNIADREQRVQWLKREIAKRTNYKDIDSISPAMLTADVVYRNMENELVMAQSELEGFRAKSPLLQDQLAFYKAKLRTLDDKDMELRNMQRELDILDAEYKRYVSQLEDTRVSEALDMERISNVTLIEGAVVPFQPVRLIPIIPTRILHICAGIIAGLIVGLGYAFLVEQFDHTFNGREQMEQILKVPCVAVIPRR